MSWLGCDFSASLGVGTDEEPSDAWPADDNTHLLSSFLVTLKVHKQESVLGGASNLGDLAKSFRAPFDRIGLAIVRHGGKEHHFVGGAHE
jgi:hypothetical protein